MKKGYRFQVLVYSLLSALLFTVTCTLSTTYAADASVSADLKSKFETFLKSPEFASKVAQLKQEINVKLQNKAYVGTVKTKSSNTLTIASLTGPKLVTVNLDTVYETKSKRTKYSFKALSEEDYVAALGDIDENGMLIARKIVQLPSPAPETKTFIWGQVAGISDKLVVKDKDLKNITVTTTSDTTFKKGGNEISFADIKLGDFAIVTGLYSDTQILKSDYLYILPTAGFLKIKKVATPSAQISTSSAKKK
ncbi:MAG: DUF5666 domain-containing protein [Candidatus Daviesbacteria bacterium]|nr:DUF5666 domain-containing protein [Candidatus Daviesbacteria bacterium]